MEYKIRWLEQATEDLETIHEYLSKEIPDRATEIVTEIYIKALSLCRFPKRYEGVLGYRRFVVLGSYKIFYKVYDKEKVVEIHYIRHTSRGNMK